jgi:hypothetical protein
VVHVDGFKPGGNASLAGCRHLEIDWHREQGGAYKKIRRNEPRSSYGQRARLHFADEPVGRKGRKGNQRVQGPLISLKTTGTRWAGRHIFLVRRGQTELKVPTTKFSLSAQR